MSTVANEVGAEPSLASILSAEPADDAPAAPEIKTPAPEARAETPEQPRGADGKFTAKQPETTPEQPAKEPTQERPDWVGPLIAERRRRQAAERAMSAQPPQQGQQPAKPDFFENPERAVGEQVSQANAELDGKFFRLSLKAARASHTDYDEAGAAFVEAAKRDPRLIDALRADEDPGELIYSIGTHIREMGDVGGDIVRYREKVTAETRKQLAEKDVQLKAKDDEIASLKKQLTEFSTVGRSLNTTTSVRPAVEETDDDDLKSLVRFGRKPPG